ncbi:MAG: hypothetical protein JRN57_02625 [Nitrososphaerota archaeon]|nr:hypothetical protein [Nitrososphaerota archaeon]
MANQLKGVEPRGEVVDVAEVQQVPAHLASSNTGILDNKRNKIELSESEARPTVTVRLKRGAWEIEINTREDRVQQAVESVLAGMASKEPVLVESQEARLDDRKGETSRSVLTTMWKEGWFATSRSLSEVHEEMSRRGYHYDRTAVSHTLVDLVREGSLFRDGSMRNYRYVQKYPFKGQAGTS